jgi:hypothetical protein
MKAYGGVDVHNFYSENLKERDHTWAIGVEWYIILKWTFKKGADWIHLCKI